MKSVLRNNGRVFFNPLNFYIQLTTFVHAAKLNNFSARTFRAETAKRRLREILSDCL